MKIPEDLYPEIISAVIGILTIISSAVFLAINIRINRKTIARDVERTAYANFYIPIKFRLGYINNIIKHYPDVDIFCKRSGDLLYENRRHEILMPYQEFIDWIRKTEFCFSKKIDKQIFLIIDHMQCVITYYNDGESLVRYKNKYPLPDLELVINSIDEEFVKSKFV